MPIDVPVFANDKEKVLWALSQVQDAAYLLRTESGITAESNPNAYEALERLDAGLDIWQWWWGEMRW